MEMQLGHLFRYKSQRLKNFYINTSSEISIKKDLIDNQRIFNVIIEDASHTLKDQIISLFMLFKILIFEYKIITLKK